MVLGWNIAAQITAILAIAATGNGLTVPFQKRSVDVSPRIDNDYYHDIIATNFDSLKVSTEGLPSGVIRQPVVKVPSKGTTSKSLALKYSQFSDLSKRDANVTRPFEIIGPDTEDDLADGFISDFFTLLELFDGNGLSIGVVFVAIDTGSADLWAGRISISDPLFFLFGAFDPELDKTNSSKLLLDGKNFTLQYEDYTETTFQFWTGSVGALNSSTPLKNFQFGSALTNNASVGGVFGIGPTSNEGVPVSERYSNYPVALKEQGHINKVAFSTYFAGGLIDSADLPQQILWGGLDHGLYTGELVVFPNQYERWPAVHLDTITTASGNVYELNRPVIIDTGTTTGILPDKFVDEIDALFTTVNNVTVEYPTNGSLTIDFGTLKLDVPYTNLWIDVNGTIIPREFLKTSENQNLTLFGGAILESAYIVFDYEANTTSIAQANLDPTYSDIVAIQ